MPLQHGVLNDHISRVFGGRDSSTFWQRLREWEELADETLVGLGKSTGDDPFRIPLRNLPRNVREEMIDLRGGIFDFEGLFKNAQGTFQVWKDVEDGTKGFGSFSLPREAFIGVESAEELAAKLAYVTQTVEIDPFAKGASRYSLSGSTLRAQTFLDAGKQLTEIGDIADKTRLVFDVETPGFDARKGIWQLSARMMRGDAPVLDEAGEVRKVNFLFRNAAMDGYYGLGEERGAMLFEDFYETLRGGKVDWIDEQNFVPRMTQFLEMAQESDYLVGQNTAFDVVRLKAALKGKQNASPEFRALVDALDEKITSGKVVDTRLFSRALFGDIDISPHLKGQDIHTKVSMENVLLETSFLDDLASDLGDDGWRQIRARISQGMHHGDVDTWFEDHLVRMQADVFSGRRTGILVKRTLQDKDLIEKIVEAQAITPYTKQASGFTALENLVHHQRRWDSDLAGRSISAKLREGGIFQNWADSVLTQDGVISRKARLADSGFDAVQAAAMEMNLPFAGLSSLERLISTKLGTHSTVVGPGNASELRALMGDVIGGTMFRQRDQMAIFGGTNVALPLELIQAAERSQMIGEPGVPGVNVLSTRFGDALESGVNALETVRLSTITWGDQKDVALVADIFKSSGDVDRFVDFLRGLGTDELARYGISPDMVDEYASVLRRHGQELGVQIGILEGKNNRSIRQLVNLLEDVGYGVDSQHPALRTAVFGVEGLDGVVGTTPVMMDTGDVLASRQANILDHTREVARLTNELANPELDPAIARSVEMARAGGDVNRIYSFADKQIQAMKKIRPRHLGIAGGTIAGYYLWNRRQKRAPYMEAFAQQEYEDPFFYERYKAEMGEEVPRDYRVRSSASALDTAGMVQYLDRNKTRHHQMGANRHDHLFGG